MFSKRAILSVIDLPSFGLSLNDLDGAGEFMGMKLAGEEMGGRRWLGEKGERALSFSGSAC